MEHTKGKWKIDKTLSTNIKSGDVFIAGIHNQDKRIEKKNLLLDYDTSETDANANLIRSAPDMLATLNKCEQVLVNKLDDVGGLFEEEAIILKLIEDVLCKSRLWVLKKAEGEIK